MILYVRKNSGITYWGALEMDLGDEARWVCCVCHTEDGREAISVGGKHLLDVRARLRGKGYTIEDATP